MCVCVGGGALGCSEGRMHEVREGWREGTVLGEGGFSRGVGGEGNVYYGIRPSTGRSLSQCVAS
mgnify:CR=1 FL=1